MLIKKWHERSLRFKFLSSVIAIILVFGLAVALIISRNEFRLWHQFLLDRGNGLGKYIADLSRDPILENEPLQLNTIVKKAAEDPELLYTIIYDDKGAELTSLYSSFNLKNPFVRSVIASSPKDIRAKDLAAIIKRRKAISEVSATISFGSEVLGHVVIGLSEDDVVQGVRATVRGIILAELIALIMAVFLLYVLQRAIVRPVTELAGLMGKVSHDKDYSVRAEVVSRDELGTLARGFNEMLDQIQKRDHQIASHRDFLAQEVRERTKELMESNRQLQQEIVERRQTQDQLTFKNVLLSSQAEIAHDGILIVDENEKIILFNRRFVELFRLSRELVEQGNDGPVLKRVVEQAADPEGFLKRVRFLYEHRNEKSFDEVVMADGKVLDRYTAPMFGTDGKYYGRVWYFHDSTARKEAAEKLRKAYEDLKSIQAQLLQSEKMASVGQLAAGVAHEINNPAAFVIGNLDVLQQYIGVLSELLAKYEKMFTCLKEPEPGRVQQVLGEIEKFKGEREIDAILADLPLLTVQSIDGMVRIKRIVKDLRSFSHTDEGRREEADVRELIDSALNIAWNEIKYKAEIVKEYGEVPLIPCYPQQLGQVFLNLLVNAVQAIPERGKITLRTFADAGHVVIEIADTGCGMAEDVRKRVFEPFFTTKPVGKGTGLGLSLAYNIVEQHKGEISVASCPGVGTTFTIRLPK